jgi:hypothetical protein
MINNGKNNVMPAQADKLTPEQIHVLAAYVWGLSNHGRSRPTEAVPSACLTTAQTPGSPAGWPCLRADADVRPGATPPARWSRCTSAEEDLPARRQRLVRRLALGPGLGSRSWCSTACPGWSGTQRQAVLFDLGARRFYIFGLVLYPQDFIYLTGLLIISAYALFLFTAVAGRLWCGYACPQTVYTEIFLWIERKVEGDRIGPHEARRAPCSRCNKLLRKGGKQAVWISCRCGPASPSSATSRRSANWAVACTLGFGPWEWFWVLFYGFATYGNAGFMREQVCKYMCPYARFQSAMFDKDTLIISYDAEARRAARCARPQGRPQGAEGLGHCVDCTLCVQVCPTGIDIRNGLQYECIGCAPASTCATA